MSKSVIRYIVYGGIFLLVFLAGAFGTYYWMNQSTVTVEEQSQVLLEKITTVAKLVSVEGVFSEIYEHENKWEPLANNPLVFPLFSPSFEKKALIIVKAKVSVGYNLEDMDIEIDHTNKKIIFSNIPDPEIIALEHDLEYYDIQESTFNSFSKEELTALNKKAKEFIREKALESDLFLKAEEQGNKMLDIIQFMVQESGFEVEYSQRENQENLFD